MRHLRFVCSTVVACLAWRPVNGAAKCSVCAENPLLQIIILAQIARSRSRFPLYSCLFFVYMAKHRKLQMRAFCFGALNRGRCLCAANENSGLPPFCRRQSPPTFAGTSVLLYHLNSVIYKIMQKAQTAISRLRFLVHSTGVEPAWIAPQDP